MQCSAEKRNEVSEGKRLMVKLERGQEADLAGVPRPCFIPMLTASH